MNQLISVIMPVYNVESYVVRSINSVLNQTYKNLELIIVDDGSTDRSGMICDQFMEKDGRVRVIHQENGGLSHARNTGLAMAIGDYVSFIDSDDFYEIHFIEYLYQSCVENDCEIGICD